MAGKTSGRVSFSYVTGDLYSISQNVSPSRTLIFLATITSKRLLRRLPGLFPWKRLLCEIPCGQGGFLECTAHVPVPQGCREGKEKSGAREGESRGTWHARSRAWQFVPLLQPRRLSWYLVYVHFLYLSKVSIILPVFLLVCPFFGNVVIFFISHFHFAQKTLSRKSLGTHSSLEESFTGLID